MLLKLRYNTILHIFALTGVALLDIACGCEDGWVPFQDSCYIAIPKPESWFDAMMQSPEENEFILNYTRHLHPGVSQTPYRYWVGAHDLAVEGHWTWANSHQRINYSSWAPGEPNSYGGDQDCMEIQGYQNYLWDDNACDAKLFAICETENTGAIVGRALSPDVD